jgi:3-hydroxyisobutyrate dehydrogenase-like beta-hydroxyacid dehydrogenase
MTKKIGIVGLGVMGRGMAVNFLKKGFQVNVWNRTVSVSESLKAQGVHICASPKEVAGQSDVVFEITANDESSRSVWLGAIGILAGSTTQKILITSATLSYVWVDELINQCLDRKFQFLDVPVTGGRIGAESGKLTLLCGGDRKLVDSLQPVFDAIAMKKYYFGASGQGSRYKLILNYMQALHVVGFGQAMRMAKAHGMDEATVADALTERPGGVITGLARDRYLKNPTDVTFAAGWMVKDLTYAKEFAGNIEVSLLDDILEVYKKAVESGYGNEDWMDVNKLS